MHTCRVSAPHLIDHPPSHDLSAVLSLASDLVSNQPAFPPLAPAATYMLSTLNASLPPPDGSGREATLITQQDRLEVDIEVNPAADGDGDDGDDACSLTVVTTCTERRRASCASATEGSHSQPMPHAMRARPTCS